MDNTIRVFSGRTFSSDDIELIKWTRTKYPKLTISEFARTICEFLDWNTLAGKAKLPQCIDFLKILESEGVLLLPEKSVRALNLKKRISSETMNITSNVEINGSVKDFAPISLEIVKSGVNLKRWRAYMDKYHMLGDKSVFGCRLRYFIKSGEIELGCIQFSASSWALKDREKWIGWTLNDRKKRLNLIINNSRFLIFPWVHIKYLASKALSLVAKRIQKDWIQEYFYEPVLLETFVDLEFFKGTCYKAANWKYLGQTEGRGRMDRNNKCELSKKAIFMYPLQKDFKLILKGEKPFKAVNPDE